MLAFWRFLWYNFLMKNEKRTATSNAEMVTISRAEYESQQAQLTELKLQNQWLLEQLGLAKKRQFGSSSEKLQEELVGQLSLSFNELEAYAFGTKSTAPEQIAVKAHARKRQSGNVLDVVPEGTPTEVVEHRLSGEELVCASCGSRMEEIGKEIHRTLQMKPAQFWIREDVYYTYACKNCELKTGEANILKTPKEPALLPGSFASAEAVAHIAVQKFVMFSPLYRLEQEFHRQGLKLSRQTMSNWLLNSSEMWLQPIYNALHKQLCKESVLHADETTLQVLKGGDQQILYVAVPNQRLYGASHCSVRIPAHAESGACGNLPEELFRMAPCGWVPGIPQTAGEYPGGWVLGSRTAKI